MKLHRISVHNFMSLRSFELNGLDDHLTYVVGPNGAGKTTVFRALRTLRDAFAAVHRVNQFTGLGLAQDRFLIDLQHHTSRGMTGVTPTEVDISIEITLDTPREADLLSAFLTAAMTNREQLQAIPQQGQPHKNLSDAGLATFSSWLLDAFRGSDLAWLHRGIVRMRCWPSAHDPRLIVGYTCDCAGVPITFSAGWHPSFDVGHLSGGQLEPGPLPGPDAGATLYQYLKGADPGQWSRILGVLTSLQPTGLHVPIDVEELLHFVATAPVRLIAQGVSQYPFPPAHQRLSELTGLSLRNSQSDRVSLSAVLWQILREALVFSENVRAPLAAAPKYTGEQLLSTVPQTESVSDLPMRLFWLKSGDLMARARYRQIQSTFENLVGASSSFEVVADKVQSPPDLTSPQQAPMQLDETGRWYPGLQPTIHTEPPPEIGLDIMIIGQGGWESPLADQGAGVWELLVLSVLIHDSTGRVVLLDEPAANLHPSAQRTLRDMLRSTQGQFLVVTHSQHLLPSKAEDVGQVFRLAKTDVGTLPHHFNPKSVGITEDKLGQELSRSSDVAGLLFAAVVILVEGDTEIAALSEWFPSVSSGRTLEDANVVLFSVGGKTEFGFYIRFLHAFGVPWAAIADGDALIANSSLWSALKAVGAATPSPAPTTAADFDEARRYAAAAGVFTANDAPDQEFENIPEVRAYIDDPSNGLPTKSKVRDGRQIGLGIPCPVSVADVLRQVIARFASLGVPLQPTTAP